MNHRDEGRKRSQMKNRMDGLPPQEEGKTFVTSLLMKNPRAGLGTTSKTYRNRNRKGQAGDAMQKIETKTKNVPSAPLLLPPTNLAASRRSDVCKTQGLSTDGRDRKPKTSI
jgi:hypothetical protein